MSPNNSHSFSDEESEMFDLPEYVICPIDLEDIEAIKEVPTMEEMRKIACVGFKKIYEGCKNSDLVENFGYAIDDVPDYLLDQFRMEDEVNNDVINQPSLGQEFNDIKSYSSDSRQNNDSQEKEKINGEKICENIQLIELNDSSLEQTKQPDNSAQSSFQDCYGFNEKLSEKSLNNSFSESNGNIYPENFQISKLNNEIVKPLSNFSLDKSDANYLNEKFRRIPCMVGTNSFNCSSIKFNQQMPRHEFYNQQRNLLNQMDKSENFQNKINVKNFLESSASLVDNYYNQIDNNLKNQFLLNKSKNSSRSLYGSTNG